MKMEDLARRAGCDQVVTAPDMFTAMEQAIEAVRAALPSAELARIRVLRTRAIPYVEYGTRKCSDGRWRVWVDAEMKA
jgi:hypothetical protein